MRWFTLQEVAALFGVSVSTVKRWVDKDLLETSPVPGGVKRRADAAAIRKFARHYGPQTLKVFGGILGIGPFSGAVPEGVAMASSVLEAGRMLATTFPAVVLVSFATGDRQGLARQLRESGFDGMVGAVVNDDDTRAVDELQREGWQMVCRASDDYWAAAHRLAANAVTWWSNAVPWLSNATNEHTMRKNKAGRDKGLAPPVAAP